MKKRAGLISVLLAGLLTSGSVQSLESDQFFAWGKPIEDSTQYLNAWVWLTIQSALDAKPGNKLETCEAAVEEVQTHLQHTIYHPIELWAISSELVDRVPRGEQANREYRSQYLLADTYPLDYARWLPPSPTLQVNKIRFGTDKLAHFFAQGWWYYKHWKKDRGEQTPEALQRQLFQFGADLERGRLGMYMTGVFSAADLEANYQGFLFYRQLCHTDEPLITRQNDGWRFSKKFDFNDYIYPNWDESWNPNVYSRIRWKSIRSTIAGYCPALNSEWVKTQRAYYAGLDEPTATEEMIQELVDAGEIPDPQEYDITAVCGSTDDR